MLMILILIMVSTHVLGLAIELKQDHHHSPTGLNKRAPHPTKFLEPSQGQYLVVGSYFRVKIIDGGLNNHKVRFVLSQDQTTTTEEEQELQPQPDRILYGRHSDPNGEIAYEGFFVEDYLSLLNLSLPLGPYRLRCDGMFKSGPSTLTSVDIILVESLKKEKLSF